MQVPGFPIQLCDSLSSMSVNWTSYSLFSSSNIQSLRAKSSKIIKFSTFRFYFYHNLHIYQKIKTNPACVIQTITTSVQKIWSNYFFKVSQYYCIFLYSLMLKYTRYFYRTSSWSLINTHSCSKTQEKQNKQWKPSFRQIDFLKYLRVCGDRTFFQISCRSGPRIHWPGKILFPKWKQYRINWNLQELSG